MTIPGAKSVLFLSSCLPITALAQEPPPGPVPLTQPATVLKESDFKNVVFPITDLKFRAIGIEASFGTGFCLDPECRFVVTNYHVAMVTKPRKIKGQGIFQKYLATGPNDEGATLNDGISVSALRYNLSRDLAIFELRHPVPHFHGISLSLDDLQTGQEVDIYTYPKEAVNPIRSLARFSGRFKGQTTAGLLAFEYSDSNGKIIRPGASGGIVVDRRSQQIVGTIAAIAKNGERVALAVPNQSLVDFVNKVEPFLASALFVSSRKEVSPVSPDIYPRFAPPPHTGKIERRPDESPAVQMLRSKAQSLTESMQNLIAVQSFAWGTGNKPPFIELAYEVRILDGHQRFRAYPDGKRQFENVPFPPRDPAMVPGGEWSELAAMVGTEPRLKIQQAADVVLNGQRMLVFQYRADPEDDLCRWQSKFDFGFFVINKSAIVGCYGEVWTDEQANILRASQHYELPGSWKDYHAVVTYGWLKIGPNPPRLLPLTISSEAEYRKKKYWCRGRFTDYQVFTSEVKMASE